MNDGLDISVIPKAILALVCLSIETLRSDISSICSKWRVRYFKVSKNLDILWPHYNVLEY